MIKGNTTQCLPFGTASAAGRRHVNRIPCEVVGGLLELCTKEENYNSLKAKKRVTKSTLEEGIPQLILKRQVGVVLVWLGHHKPTLAHLSYRLQLKTQDKCKQ